jgi:hypothetical protein
LRAFVHACLQERNGIVAELFGVIESLSTITLARSDIFTAPSRKSSPKSLPPAMS